MKHALGLVICGVLAWCAGAVPAARADDPPKPPAPVTTEHEAQIGGKAVKYKAVAGTLPILDDKGKTKANIFHITYERTDLADPADAAAVQRARETRPITFAFNGGPGSSSVWLHLGALGPRRVKMGPEGEMVAKPAELADNDASWLGFTDLVFIDPVSTGFSRAADGEDPHQFHGLDEDARAVADFIRLYLVRNQRWMSPKYLAGESYGTTRASAVAPELQGRHGVYLSGIVLISPVLNFQTLSFDVGNDTAYWLYLPTYTATAFYHRKLKAPLDADLHRTLTEVQAWAETEYLEALALGDRLDAARKQQVAAKLAAYTGLSEQYVMRADLRVPIFNFTKELLRDEQRTVGRLDSRYKGIDRNDVGDHPDYDPAYAAIQGHYTAALNAYIRGELKYESDAVYEILTGAVHPWSYAGSNNRYVNVAERLRSAMSQNANLRVLAASGFYDLATPYFAMTYTATHLGLDESLRGNLRQTFYECGHMMYVREVDLRKLSADAAGFYAAGK